MADFNSIYLSGSLHGEVWSQGGFVGDEDDGRRGLSSIQNGNAAGHEENGKVRQQSHETHGFKGTALNTKLAKLQWKKKTRLI